MRRLAALLLALTAFVAVAAAPRVRQLDRNGDPLPNGAVARLGSVRFQPADTFDVTRRWWRRATPTVVLSPDGTTLATASATDQGARIDLLDASTGKPIRQFDLPGATARFVRFTPDGKAIALEGTYGVQFVDARTGKVTSKIDFYHVPAAIALTRDGKQMAVQPQKSGEKYVRDAVVRIWDTQTGKELASLPGRGASCRGLAFGSDGKRLLLWSIVPTNVSDNGVSYDGMSKVALACIDRDSRKIIGETTIGQGQFVALCPDGETVAIEAADHKSVRIHHLPTNADRCTLRVSSSRFAFAPNGKALFALDENGQGTLWDVRKGGKVRDLEGSLGNKDVEVIGFAQDGQILAALDGGWESAARIVVWNAASGKRIGQPAGHEGSVTCIAYAPGGKWLASGSIDKTVRLWEPTTGKQLRVLSVHKGAIVALAFSADGKLVASSSRSGETRVSNVADGKLVAEYPGRTKTWQAKSLAFSTDGKLLYMGGEPHEVNLQGGGSPAVVACDLATGKEVMELKAEGGGVLAIGHGGTWAISGDDFFAVKQRLRLWDLNAKKAVGLLTLTDDKHKEDRGFGDSTNCGAASFSQDGRMLVTSQVSTYQGIRPSYGSTKLLLWDRASGEEIRNLGPIITRLLAFSPGGRLLASGSAGRSGHLTVGYGAGIDVWDILTGDKISSLPITPECLAFSPDGVHLATGGRDHCVTIWRAPKPRERRQAKAPTAADREAWWKALGGPTKDAYAAIRQMIDAPEGAVALLGERVKPVRVPDDVEAVGKLIARLNGDEFDDREKAQAELEKLGEGIIHLLTKALSGKVDLELRLRVQRLLNKYSETSMHAKQQRHAVTALEWIDTPAARGVLRKLAGGAPGARVTQEAKAALARLPQ